MQQRNPHTKFWYIAPISFSSFVLTYCPQTFYHNSRNCWTYRDNMWLYMLTAIMIVQLRHKSCLQEKPNLKSFRLLHIQNFVFHWHSSCLFSFHSFTLGISLSKHRESFFSRMTPICWKRSKTRDGHESAQVLFLRKKLDISLWGHRKKPSCWVAACKRSICFTQDVLDDKVTIHDFILYLNFPPVLHFENKNNSALTVKTVLRTALWMSFHKFSLR